MPVHQAILALTIPLLGLPLAGMAAPSSLSTGLANCAQVTSPTKRLACFDALAETRPSTDDGASTPPPPMLASGNDGAPSPPMTAPAAPESRSPAPRSESGDDREFLGVRLYRPNYLLPVAYNDNPNRNLPEDERIDIPFLGDALDNVEMKFQISFEVPVWTQILRQPLDIYFAYTQLAFFQAYNSEYSSPFRETNYEPEIGLNWQPDLDILGWTIHSLRAIANHQSNGRSEPLSRSWNRLIGQAEADNGNLSLALRIWTPLGANPPDNPDIYEYLGYGELHASYDLKKHHFGVMFRNPTHPSLQLDWTYPLGDTIRLYLQYFNGFGESLLDFDHSVNRIGAGFLVNEWP